MPDYLYVVSRQPTGAAEADSGCACSCQCTDCGDSPLDLDIGAARDFENALVKRLLDAGCPVLDVPHLYDLSRDHEAFRRIRDYPGPVAAFTWLAVRPARSLLMRMGAARAESADVVASMAGHVSAKACAGAVLDQAPPSPGEGRVTVLQDPAGPRWYPIIDYERCVQCGQCLNFCLFGVYSDADGEVVVANPDNCKPGCPACARVCPERAIIFPHYVDDPAIAGHEGDAACPEDAEAGGDDLQGLIDALEQLDQ